MKRSLKAILAPLIYMASANIITSTSVFAAKTSSNTGNTTTTSDICQSNASKEIKAAAGCSGYGNPNQLRDTITGILNAVIAVVGLVSAIYIVIGGIQYMTSAGDTSKLEKAKKTIIYALIGLIICALSFAIVNFVIIRVIG